jgi:pimeloyl-ACP methyl ester carboxylesterase/class 3 adenylate cyclase
VLPETKYAKSGDVSIAYQAFGEGPPDLVFVPGFVSHVEHWWEEPSSARSLQRLASFSRLILFDKRGTGLSDPVLGVPTLEERMDDVRAVMDAVGSEKAALLGDSEGGPMCCLFAATYPDRTSALAIYGSAPRGSQDPDSPSVPYMDVLGRFVDALAWGWGEGVTLPLFAPSMAGDDRLREWWARFERLGASPGMMRAVVQMIAETDVTDILSTIRVPTLVLHRSGDLVVDVAGGRYLSDQIPDAKYVELPGEDHLPFVGDVDALLDEIEEFLTGTRQGPEPDRILATVLFTDIVGSTERAAELGDRRWGDLLESHLAMVRRQLERFRGREINTAGDGFLATFDGPARGIRCAEAIGEAARGQGLEIRAGLHTGELDVVADQVQGIAVHLGARVAALAGPNEVLVSSTVRDLVAGSGINFDDRGTHVLKGVPGEWRLFAVTA